MSPTPAPFCLQLPTSYVRLFNAVYRQQYRMAAFLAILACSYQMMLHLSSAVADFVPPSSSIPSSPLNSNLLQSRASPYNLFPSTSSSSSFFASFFNPSSHLLRSTHPPPSSSSSSTSSSVFSALSSSSILPYAVQAGLSSLLTEPKTWQLSMTILGIVLQSWILIPPVSADPINFYPRPPPSGWRRGRTSWYGTPKEFVAPYISTRGGGESAFGILEWGGCGYTNSDASLAFNRDEVAAYSDANIDYPGVCGRCYEVKCVNGLVLGRNDTPVDYLHFYYYPKYASVPDSYNRRFPGNIAETNSHVHVQCWDETKSIIVHIIDICPCIYAPQGQKPYEQPSCCGNFSAHPKAGQHQFDLSYWAYEKLAHPMYSEMMLDYRPVDCHTHAPFAPAAYEAPGYINRAVLYDEEPEAGWAWFPYMTPTHNFNVTAKGWGRNGGTAACAELGPGGGMTFLCRNCFMEGYQPFVGVNRIQFWIRNRNQPGTVPTVKAIISNHEAATPTYCKNEVALSNGATGGNVNVVQATENGSDGWMKWDIPFSKWGCYDYGDASRMDKIDFQNYGSSNIWFCLDDLVMERSTGNINLLPPSK